MRFKIISTSVVAILGALIFASCAPAPISNQTSAPSVSPMSAEQARDAFEKISTASCDKAMAEGVVEQSEAADGFTLVMVPKDQAYQDFSAAYFEPADKFELIWETDALSACGAAIQFALAQDSGTDVDMSVSFDETDGTFSTEQDLGEFGVSKLKYEVAADLLTTIEIIDSATPDKRTIRYGNLQESDWNILRTAVDRYLADK